MTFKDSNTHRVPAALRDFDSLPDSAGVRLPVVMGLMGCSAATVWRMTADGRLPTPRKPSPKITVWPVGELRRTLGK